MATASFDRYRGVLLGLPVGDGLGSMLEIRSFGDIDPVEGLIGGGS